MTILPSDASQIWIANRYRVFAPLGSGGLGVVYSGWDHELNRPVAIKRIRQREDVSPQGLLEEAFNEARALALLRHPHVVRLYDFGMDEQGPYFVMEHIEGYTLQHKIDSGIMTVEEFRHIAHMALEGLSAAHRLGIIHMDIKPSNLMLHENPDGRLNLKILDFGLSRLQTNAQSGETCGTSIYGTYFYVSPEQILQGEIGPRTDLYSLGHVLYHALTRLPAFYAPSIEEVLKMHLHATAVSVQDMRPDMDAGLAAWLHRLMALRPEDRFPDAITAVRELARIHLGTLHEAERYPAGVVGRIAKRTTASIRKIIDATFGAPAA
jgi:serine/threonine protein kinase